ncbi:MAG TPA: hypothetical protein DF984_05435 [Anaerolineaceae bacterium]|nr:hypothetical protein [Anaerolineaceae bacterium]
MVTWRFQKENIFYLLLKGKVNCEWGMENGGAGIRYQAIRYQAIFNARKREAPPPLGAYACSILFRGSNSFQDCTLLQDVVSQVFHIQSI